MLYLLTFDHSIYYNPQSVAEFLVQQEDGQTFDQMTFTPVEDPVRIDDVLQPALRSGFKHPEGLLVDASLVEVMFKPQHLEMASAEQLALEAQLEELNTGTTSVEDASFENQQDQVAREARHDHGEALSWANTVRRDLLKRPINNELQQHWDNRGA